MARRPTTSYLRTVLIIVLLVSVGQVSWWILDNVRFSTSVRDGIAALYSDEVDAARKMIAHGVPTDSVLAGFPNLVMAPDSEFSVDPVLIDSLMELRHSRINRMGWEGGFFLVVLLASMWMMGYAIREDSRFRRHQRNFIAAVTHELKSPIASLQLAAETLSIREHNTESREKLTNRMMTDLSRLNGLVTNVLDASRLERGEERTPTDVSIAEEVKAAVSEVEHRAETSNVRLETDFTAGAVVHADQLGIRTAIRNVLDNALKVTASTENGVVRVGTAVRDGRFDVTISDNGIGFDSGEASHLFERFYRPGSEMTRELRGTGLGLYIVDRIMTADGGSVSAYSDGPGKGATFVLSWPVAENGR